MGHLHANNVLIQPYTHYFTSTKPHHRVCVTFLSHMAEQAISAGFFCTFHLCQPTSNAIHVVAMCLDISLFHLGIGKGRVPCEEGEVENSARRRENGKGLYMPI